MTFDVVRDIGLTIPDVDVSTYWNTPALKLNGQMIACMASHRSAEPDTLVVRVDFDRRDLLLAEDPVTYYSPITTSAIRQCWSDSGVSVRTRCATCC